MNAAAERGRTNLAYYLSALVAVLCYGRSLANGFAYDDTVIVQQNYTIHSWAKIPFALRIAYWYTSGHLYRPLTTLTMALEWILSHGSPVVFHAVSMALHVLMCVLIVRLARLWWPPLAAGCAGVVFAVWPAHVEAVANIVGQSELLCAVMLMLVVLAATRVPSRQQLWAIGLLSAAAAACKETGVVAPLLAWGVARLWGYPWRRAVLVSVAGVAFTLVLRLLVLGAFAGDAPHAAFVAGTPWQALALALSSAPRVLWLLFVPTRPSPDYSPTEAALLHPNLVLVVLGSLLVVGAIALIVRHARRPTPVTFAALFSIATFAPVCNLAIHTGVVIAERTLYSPSIGVALLYGALADTLGRRRQPLLAGGVSLAACAGAVFAALLTIQAVPIWHDSATLFAAMVDRAPTSYRTYALSASTHPTQAHAYYERALSLFSLDPVTLEDAGETALTVPDTARALQLFHRSVALDSNSLRSRTSLTVLLLRSGDTTQARALLADGLRRFPSQRTWRTMLTRVARP